MQYAAPATCLLTGLGAAVLLSLPRSPRRRERLAIGSLAVLGGVGATLLVGQVVSPGRSDCDQRTREFARWFWSERGRGAEIACVKSDFGLAFDPPPLGIRPVGALPLQPGDLFRPPSPRRAAGLGPGLGDAPAPLRPLQRIPAR